MKNLLEFPSPYGVTVIKSLYKNAFIIVAMDGTFPSPYGVTVIKSRI